MHSSHCVFRLPCILVAVHFGCSVFRSLSSNHRSYDLTLHPPQTPENKSAACSHNTKSVPLDSKSSRTNQALHLSQTDTRGDSKWNLSVLTNLCSKLGKLLVETRWYFYHSSFLHANTTNALMTPPLEVPFDTSSLHSFPSWIDAAAQDAADSDSGNGCCWRATQLTCLTRDRRLEARDHDRCNPARLGDLGFV